jgi:hypothetical protein
LRIASGVVAVDVLLLTPSTDKPDIGDKARGTVFFLDDVRLGEVAAEAEGRSQVVAVRGRKKGRSNQPERGEERVWRT